MKTKKIHVIGDIMLDSWCEGKLEKKSAEAPIKIFELKKLNYSLGGVGNLCVNLKSLRIKFNLLTIIGSDNNGKKILSLLNQQKIDFIITKLKKNTICKERFFLNEKQIFRKDTENEIKYSKIKPSSIQKIKRNDLVLVSDYKKGSINKKIIKELNKKKCRIFVDPKNKPEMFKNVFFIKPNMEKFEEWCGKFSEKKAFNLIKTMNWHWLVISHNKFGVYVFNKYGEKNFYRVKKVTKPNVIGAGDIFFSCIIKSFIEGVDMFTSIELASYAATKCVMKKKIRKVNLLDFKKNIVFTNGVFDILHKGHIDLLKFSKKIGSKLILGINSDLSVKQNKGNDRPYNNLKKRIRNLKKLNIIDGIIEFNEKTPLKLISKIKPDVIVKGDDYTFSDVIGKNITNTILFKKKNNLSSTNLILKTKNSL